ncbi:unnamed protein product [Arctogadus glacialis]
MRTAVALLQQRLWGKDFYPSFRGMVHKCDTERAVDLLRQYQANLTSPQEQALNASVGKVSAIFGSQLFHALLDIQECYEVTLQLNKQQNGKEDGSEEVWEDKELVEGVTRVRVTSMTSPHRVERVVGLVSRSHVDAVKSDLDTGSECAQGFLVFDAQLHRELTTVPPPMNA